jgi:[acyl-carrier-protein] S-malonyltransferase
MTRAFVFPGQGSQFIGMGKELAETFTAAREVFAEVDDTLGEKLSTLMFSGEAEALTMTHNAQPALMAVSVAVARVIEAEGKVKLEDICKFVAGHSLGEYSALCAAGAISLADTARLLRIRGNAMQEAVPPGQGGMAALIGVDFDTAQKLATECTNGSICQAANDNGGGQVVISGSMAAIDKAIAMAAGMGIKRAIKLPVSAPFHSALMAPAAEVMQKALAETKILVPVVPVIANVTADEVIDPVKIRELLVKQVTGMVRWRETVLNLKTKGVINLVELGAGKVLSGLAKRIDPDMIGISVQTPQDIEAFLKTL